MLVDGKIQCRTCAEWVRVPVQAEQVIAWQAGALIQEVMPELSADQREMLMTQTCGVCWDEMFSDDGCDYCGGDCELDHDHACDEFLAE